MAECLGSGLIGYIYILGLYRDNGNESENYYTVWGFCRVL